MRDPVALPAQKELQAGHGIAPGIARGFGAGVNFLAHAFLSHRHPESIVGNLLADFVRGKPDPSLGPLVVQGIRNHRAIDSYTDEHPVVLESKRLISLERRRYAGIIVDVVFDHFLTHHWEKFSPEETLPCFASKVYGAVQSFPPALLPDVFRMAISRIIAEDRLCGYQCRLVIDKTLARIGDRFKHANPLGTAGEEIDLNGAALEEQFLRFFPDLMAFASGLPDLPQQPA